MGRFIISKKYKGKGQGVFKLMEISKSDMISKHIKNYRQQIVDFRSQASLHAIALFILIVSCWGISIPRLRIFAAILSAIIFIYKSIQTMSDKRTFNKIKKDIEEDINRNLTGDIRKARLYELGLVEEYRKAIRPALSAFFILFSCFLFYIISFFIFLGDIFPAPTAQEFAWFYAGRH